MSLVRPWMLRPFGRTSRQVSSRSRSGRSQRQDHARLRLEPLEERRMLSVLGMDINLYEDVAGTKGDLITDNTVEVGETFFVEITAEDRHDPQGGQTKGITQLLLDVRWDASALEELDAPFDPGAVLNPKLQDPDGSLDNNNSGGLGKLSNLFGFAGPLDAIGKDGPEWFGLFRFEAEAVGSSQITIANLDSVFFADSNVVGAPDIVWSADTPGGVLTIDVESSIPEITVGNHLLLPNTDEQEIQIYVTGGQAVQGANFYIAVVDDDGNSLNDPGIRDVNLIDGTIFAGNHSSAPDSGDLDGVYPDSDTEPQWEGRTVTTASGTVNADGLLATVTIDTRGIDEGTWQLTLDTMANGISSPTEFIWMSNQIIQQGAQLIVGSITIDSAPEAHDDSITVAEGGITNTLDSGASTLQANDTDDDVVDPDVELAVIATPITAPAYGTVSISPDGTFSYTHDGSEHFTDSFVYEVYEIGKFDGPHDTATVHITVTPVNDSSPVANDDFLTVDEGGTTAVLDSGESNVLANDTDADVGDTLTVEIEDDPSHGTVSLNSDGTFSYQHDDSENFEDSFTYYAKDEASNWSEMATVYVTITPVNDWAPVAIPDSLTAILGTAATELNSGATSLLANDLDIDLGDGSANYDSLTVNTTPINGPSHGTLTLQEDGTFSYAHDGSANLTDSFTYEVKDEAGHTANGTVAITIELPPDLFVEINLYEDDNGQPGALIPDTDHKATVVEGDTFFVEILVGDFRDGSVGIEQLTADIEWDADQFDVIDSPFDATSIVTDGLPDDRDGTLDQGDGLIEELTGSTDTTPIGSGTLERFALLHFQAEPGTSGTTLLDGTYTALFGNGPALNPQIEQQLIEVEAAAPSISIESAFNGDDADDPAGPLAGVGTIVNGTYEVANTGNVALTDVTLTDDSVAETPVFIDGDLNDNDILDVGETWTYSLAVIVQAGQVAATAEVTATADVGGDATDSDLSHYFGVDVQLTTTANGNSDNVSPGPILQIGDPITWIYWVQSNAALGNLALTDDHGETIVPIGGDSNSNGVLDADETWSFEAAGTVAAGAQAGDVALNAVTQDGSGTSIVVTQQHFYFGVNAGVQIEAKTNGEDADAPTGPNIEVGEDVDWTYEVSNSGDVPLGDVTVTDNHGQTISLASGDDDTDGLLDIDETWIFEATGTALAGQSVGLGSVTANPVDFDGSDITGLADVTDSDPTHHWGVGAGIAIETLTNDVDADDPAGPIIPTGGNVTWTYAVTNTGNVALGFVTVADDQGVTVTLVDGDEQLNPGETWRYQAIGTAESGQYANIATAEGTPVAEDGSALPNVDPVAASDPSHYLGAEAGINIERTVNGQAAETPTGPVVPMLDILNWTYVVTNPGNVALSDVTVTDDLGQPIPDPSGDANGNNLLDPGETWIYHPANPALEGQQLSTGSVSANPVDDSGADIILLADVSDSDSSYYLGALAGIEIQTTTNDQDADDAPGPALTPGESVVWTYLISNMGNVPIADLVVVDNQGVTVNLSSGDENSDGLLDVEEVWTYQATDTVLSGQYSNIGSVEGKPVQPDGSDIAGLEIIVDSDPSHYFGLDAAVQIEMQVNGQDADQPTGPTVSADEVLTLTYTVTNLGNSALGDVAVSDTHGTTISLISGDSNSNDVLDIGETWVYQGATLADPGQISMTADVVATPIDQQGEPLLDELEVEDDDPANYFAVDSGISVETLVNGADADVPTGPSLEPGDSVSIEYRVTNPGNVPISDVVLSDDNGTPGDVTDDFELTLISGDTNDDGLLDPTETWLYTRLRTAEAGQFQATATVSGVDTLQDTVADEDLSHYLGGLASLSGWVYVDSDNNGFFGDSEFGLPYVMITLTGVDTAGNPIARSTQTAENGSYHFADLPTGTYEIAQHHPAGFTDGKDTDWLLVPSAHNDRFSGITIDASEDLTDFNFGERGLAPEVISLRLFLASTPPVAQIYRQMIDSEPLQGGTPQSDARVVQTGSLLTVTGTDGDDSFEFRAGESEHSITINGQLHQFDADQVTDIVFDGGAGFDSALLQGTGDDETAQLRPGAANLTGDDYSVDVVHAESILANGGGGNDSAELSDSAGHDRLRAHDKFALLFGQDFANWVFDFQQVKATSNSGGNDTTDVETAIDFILQKEGGWSA